MSKHVLNIFSILLMFLKITLYRCSIDSYINSLKDMNINNSWECAKRIDGINSSNDCVKHNSNSSSSAWTCCFFNSTSIIPPVNISYTGIAFCLPIHKTQISNLSSLIGKQNFHENTQITYYTNECFSHLFILRQLLYYSLLSLLYFY